MAKFSSRVIAVIGAILVIVALYAVVRNSQDDQAPVAAPEVADVQPTATPTPPIVLNGDEILDPPVYYADLPDPLTTNHKGEVRIAWTPVHGAKSYVILVFDHDGKIAKKYYTAWHVIYLKDVPIDSGASGMTYLVRVASVNANHKKGEFGPSRMLHVKPLTNIVAPLVQEIRVED